MITNRTIAPNSTVKKLNTLLATYKIYVHKLLNYQWLIQSSKHPELNEELDKYSEEAEHQIESIVDQIISLGDVPLGTWAKWQRVSNIKFRIPNRDFKTILQGVIEDSKVIQLTAQKLGTHAAHNKDKSMLDLAQGIQVQLNNRIEDVERTLRMI